jgi:ethanolamine utilization protein EutN
MLIARVIGDVTATQKHASHEGQKLLLVQPVELDGSTPRGDAVIAVDAVDAGLHDLVLLVTEGYSAMTSVNRPESPIDMAVIGVIDRFDLIGLPAAVPARVAAAEKNPRNPARNQ